MGRGKLLTSPGISEEVLGKNEQHIEIHDLIQQEEECGRLCAKERGPRENYRSQKPPHWSSPCPSIEDINHSVLVGCPICWTYAALLFGDTDQSMSHSVPDLPLMLNRCPTNK